MVSRALSLAAASVLGCLMAAPVQAQQNLDAGKSAGQLFEGTCSACHRSARGLLKTVSPSALPDFLSQHYTTGGEMAQKLSAYLTSNRAAAADPGASGKRGAKPQSNLRPDAPIGTNTTDAGAEPTAADKPSRRRGRPEIGGQSSGASPQGEAPAAEATGPRGKLAKRGKRGQPPVTPEQPVPDVASKPEATSPKETQRSIDAGVPVPEPVVLPPPTAADIKDVKPAEAKPAQAKPDAPSAAAAEKPATDKPAEAASTAPGGSPASR